MMSILTTVFNTSHNLRSVRFNRQRTYAEQELQSIGVVYFLNIDNFMLRIIRRKIATLPFGFSQLAGFIYVRRLNANAIPVFVHDPNAKLRHVSF